MEYSRKAITAWIPPTNSRLGVRTGHPDPCYSLYATGVGEDVRGAPDEGSHQERGTRVYARRALNPVRSAWIRPYEQKGDSVPDRTLSIPTVPVAQRSPTPAKVRT